MKDSIIVDMDYADYDLIDGSPNVERHHVIFGTAGRKLADEDGLWVPLTKEHHTEGKISAHKCIFIQRLLQILGQLAWEKHYYKKLYGNEEDPAREAFRRRYGKSYL